MENHTVSQTLESKIRASVLGAAFGDALGAPFEFNRPEWVCPHRLQEMWFDTLDCTGGNNVFGVWGLNSPAGTGTDDTRYNWLFLELALEKKRLPSAAEFAERFLDVYHHPDRYFPTHVDLARKQSALWEPACCGYLGKRSTLLPDVNPEVLRHHNLSLNFPALIGLITMTTAGILFSGKPEEAYKQVYETDFIDLAYAKECVAVLAYMISALLPGTTDARSVIDQALTVDPLHLGGKFGGPWVKMKLPVLLRSLPEKCTERELTEHLSRALQHYHEFDPYKTLAIAVASVYAFPNDPMKAIVSAVNHREVEPNGQLGRFLDIDCYACVTGALAGAATGIQAFPAQAMEQVVNSNRQVYGIDLEKTIRELVKI